MHQSSVGQKSENIQLAHINTVLANINVNEDYKNGNWDPVLEAVKDKRIILIGEANHGSKEIFVVRNDLIKKLHKELGFEVILFESGIGEVGTIELNKSSLTSKQMVNGFFWGWRTKAFTQLMQYVKENDICIGGFDVQKTGGTFSALLEEATTDNTLNIADFQNLEQKFNEQKRLLANRNTDYESVEGATQLLIKEYKHLLNQLGVTPIQDNKTEHATLVSRTLENRISYLQYYLNFVKTRDLHKRWRDRDSLMASNVEWLVENFYQGKKIIIVAHNFHIAKYNEKEEVMGEFLNRQHGSEMYALGVLPGSGTYADNSGKEKSIGPIDSSGFDIKEVVMSLKDKVHFIDIPAENMDKHAFLFNTTILNDTFINLSGDNKITLAKHFDGLLLIDKVSPPSRQ